MLKQILCTCLLALVVPVLRAKEQPISAVVNNATYVFVTTSTGDVFSPDVTPEDRQAVQNVQEAIEKWGRYKLVYKRQEADLILVVRTGRTGSVEGGVRVGTASGSNRVSGMSVGGEAGDPLDTLEVFMPSQTSPLWRGRARHGLNPPEIPLMKEFRSKVEAAAKKK